MGVFKTKLASKNGSWLSLSMLFNLMLKANNKILKAACGQNYENDLEIKSLLKGF